MSFLVDVFGGLCLLLGGLLCLTGGVGLLRLPDFFTRLHAGSVTETLAAPLLIFGVMLETGWSLETAKLLLILVIMFAANPSIAHALCRAAAHGEHKPAGFHQPSGHRREEGSSNSSNS